MRALVAALALLSLPSRSADAQPIAGTGDDPVRIQMLDPAVVAALAGPFVVRGGSPEDTLVQIDGFEVPSALHLDGHRGIAPRVALGDIVVDPSPDVSRSRVSALELATALPPVRRLTVDLNSFDFGGVVLGSNLSIAGRASTIGIDRNHEHADGIFRYEHHGARRTLVVSAFGARDVRADDELHAARVTIAATRQWDHWDGYAAVSSMLADDHRERGDHRVDAARTTIDTRAGLRHRADDIGGLTDVVIDLGEQSTMARHSLELVDALPLLPREGASGPQPNPSALTFDDTFWVSDLAAWSAVTARLSRQLRAHTALRIDHFGRNAGLAVQPRGMLELRISPGLVALFEAGAYRRAPRRSDELVVDNLEPERTTQISTSIERRAVSHAYSAHLYYQDRSRLIMRDALGELANTGFGTAYGLELRGQVRRGNWFIAGGAALSRSNRRDHQRAVERPSQFEQPLRAHAVVARQLRRWTFGARTSFASGLPTTLVQQSVYNADSDTYEPILGRTYDERLPDRYELALRVDYARGTRIHAFVDVLLTTGTFDHSYSFDYKTREPVTAPIIPYAGIRGSL